MALGEQMVLRILLVELLDTAAPSCKRPLKRLLASAVPSVAEPKQSLLPRRQVPGLVLSFPLPELRLRWLARALRFTGLRLELILLEIYSRVKLKMDILRKVIPRRTPLISYRTSVQIKLTREKWERGRR